MYDNAFMAAGLLGAFVYIDTIYKSFFVKTFQ